MKRKEVDINASENVSEKTFWKFNTKKTRIYLFFLENKLQVLIYDLKFLILKDLFSFIVGKITDLTFFFLAPEIIGVSNLWGDIIFFNFFQKKVIFSIKGKFIIKTTTKTILENFFVFFFKEKNLIRILNPNTILNFFFRPIPKTSFYSSYKKMQKIMTFSLKNFSIIGAHNPNLNQNMQLIKSTFPVYFLFIKKLSKLWIMVDISSRRILLKFSCSTFLNQLLENIKFPLKFSKIFLKNQNSKKKLIFPSDYGFFSLNPIGLQFYYKSSKLDNNLLFFIFKKKKNQYKSHKTFFHLKKVKPQYLCTGSSFWGKTFQENWGGLESRFVDIKECRFKKFQEKKVKKILKKTLSEKNFFWKKQHVFLNFL